MFVSKLADIQRILNFKKESFVKINHFFKFENSNLFHEYSVSSQKIEILKTLLYIIYIHT